MTSVLVGLKAIFKIISGLILVSVILAIIWMIKDRLTINKQFNDKQNNKTWRAKRVDNGEWVDGNLITSPFGNSYIVDTAIIDITKGIFNSTQDLKEKDGIFEVVPETIIKF